MLISTASLLSLFLLFEPAEGQFEVLQKQGFIEIANPYMSQQEYGALYDSFDHMIDLLSTDPVLFDALRDSEKEFLAEEKLLKRYCKTPPSYRDPAKDATKKRAKIYFQFIPEHYELLQQKYPAVLEHLADFFEKMQRVDALAKKLFEASLDQFDSDCPGIRTSLYGSHKELTVVTKIVRYKKSEQWGTTPHVDKSGLSLIWDSTDANHDSLVLYNDIIDQFEKPIRAFGFNSVILIPGACLSKVNLPIKPTLHGVLPLASEYRHALISFALVPDISTDDIQTDYIP